MSEEKRDNLIRENLDYEVDQNAIDFFAVLLKVDKRINPEKYESANPARRSSNA